MVYITWKISNFKKKNTILKDVPGYVLNILKPSPALHTSDSDL